VRLLGGGRPNSACQRRRSAAVLRPGVRVRCLFETPAFDFDLGACRCCRRHLGLRLGLRGILFQIGELKCVTRALRVVKNLPTGRHTSPCQAGRHFHEIARNASFARYRIRQRAPHRSDADLGLIRQLGRRLRLVVIDAPLHAPGPIQHRNTMRNTVGALLKDRGQLQARRSSRWRIVVKWVPHHGLRSKWQGECT
jgi:hypothetical protein